MIWFAPDPENEPQLRSAHRFICTTHRCELTAGAVLQAHTQRMAPDTRHKDVPGALPDDGAQRD